MTLDEFADWVHAIGLRPSVTEDPEKHLAYLALGLAGEAGEAVEVVKKHLRDGPLDMALMRHELGDVLFFWAGLCRQLDIDMHEIRPTRR
jgi:NTP pyrophosphatase (non-canonical NTP hydrolase)